MRAALQWSSQLIGSANPAVLQPTAQNEKDKVSGSSTASASVVPKSTAQDEDDKVSDSSAASSSAVPKPTAQAKDDKVSDSSAASASAVLKPTAQTEDNQESDSSAASASMNSIESSSPSTLDIPISISKPTESPLLTETPQPQALESTQPSSKSTPTPTTPHPEQLTREQMLAKEVLKRQMSRAKQLKTNLKGPAPAAQKAPKQETPEDQKPDVLDEFPEEPPPLSKGVVASIWNIFRR